MAFYLALKEIWRSRGRYLLIAMIVALITMLHTNGNRPEAKESRPSESRWRAAGREGVMR